MWRSIRRSVFSFTLICGLCPRPITAAIFDSDDRRTVSTAPGSPFAAVGMVKRGSLLGRYTTGTLVDDCHVLTAQHVLGLRASAIGQRLTFKAAIGSGHTISSDGTVVAAGGLEKYQTAGQQFDARGSDWLLLRLDTCLGTTLGFARLRLQPAEASDLVHVESAGYPVDVYPGSGLTIDPSCAIRGVYGLVWLNDCAALPGNSGGPIFRLSSSGGKPQLEVYAIQSAAWGKFMPFRRGYENQATPVSRILPHIARFLTTRS